MTASLVDEGGVSGKERETYGGENKQRCVFSRQSEVVSVGWEGFSSFFIAADAQRGRFASSSFLSDVTRRDAA